MATPSSTLIIGAGPAGLTAAYHLTKHGQSVRVLEASSTTVGGISQTAKYKGNRFDIGGHRFFTKSSEIHRLWEEILGTDQFLQVNRQSRILYDGKFYSYPLKAREALQNLGFRKSVLAIGSYAQARVFPITPEHSYADWVSNRFGKVLFQTFFKTYTEKVWGMDTGKISADWAAQRIQGLSLSRAALGAFFPGLQRETARTLTSTFHYPRLGPGQMWEVARDKVRAQGGQFFPGQRVDTIHHHKGRVTAVEAGSVHHENFDYLLSTMPLRELIQAMRPVAPTKVVAAAESLRYRDFLTVVLIIKQPDLFSDNWIYVHDPQVKVGRIQNFRNWSRDMVSDPEKTTTLGLEYFCNEGDSIWNLSDTDLIALASKEISQLGLAQQDDIMDGTVVRMLKAYPVYDDHYKTHVATIRKWLATATVNLTPIGRNGMHKYNNQDHSMMTALLAARNILGEGPFDVWKVHTDATYDEQAEETDDQEVRSFPRSSKDRPKTISL